MSPKLQNLSDASQTCAFILCCKYFLSFFSQQYYSALHALLSAIDPGADGKLTSELSDKLSGLVGPEVIESLKQGRNERGEVWCCTPNVLTLIS